MAVIATERRLFSDLSTEHQPGSDWLAECSSDSHLFPGNGRVRLIVVLFHVQWPCTTDCLLFCSMCNGRVALTVVLFHVQWSCTTGYLLFCSMLPLGRQQSLQILSFYLHIYLVTYLVNFKKLMVSFLCKNAFFNPQTVNADGEDLRRQTGNTTDTI